jgi:hypothetical protein
VVVEEQRVVVRAALEVNGLADHVQPPHADVEFVVARAGGDGDGVVRLADDDAVAAAERRNADAVYQRDRVERGYEVDADHVVRSLDPDREVIDAVRPGDVQRGEEPARFQ